MKSIQQRNLCLTLGFPIRLTGSGSTRCSGRVEMFYNSDWGTVCDDEWDLNEADVVCRQLNCGRALSAPKEAFFGEGTGHILLDEVDCSGNEASLIECLAREMGKHDCKHSEDAGVICSESLTKPSISMNPVGEVNLDQSVNITCSISTRIYEGSFILRKTSGPFKMIEWPSQNSVTFNIHKMSFDNEGLYLCQYRRKISGREFKSPLSDSISLSIAVRLQQPSISLTSPNRGLVWSPEGAEVTRGYSFVFICSINCSYSEGQFFLISSDSTIVATKPAVNHSASFDFPIAEYKHQGSYSCVYEVRLPTRRLNSTETGAIRVVIKLTAGILLLLFVVLLVVCLVCKRGQKAKQPVTLVQTQLAATVGSCHEDDREDYVNVCSVDTKGYLKEETVRVEEEHIYEAPERYKDHDCDDPTPDSNFRKTKDVFFRQEREEQQEETSQVENDYDSVIQQLNEPTLDIYGNNEDIYLDLQFSE
ncbi:uncharacterized protein LKV04_018700 isoform 2-T2 [Tautogolabrus adspersus]